MADDTHDDDQHTDMILATMGQIIDLVKSAHNAAPGVETQMKLIHGLLETTCTFGLAFGMPDLLIGLMFAEALTDSGDRIQATKRRIKAEQTPQPELTAPVTPAHPTPVPGPAPVPAPPAGLTGDQVREILARMKENGRVH